ncbi:hypothetical protein FB567DRAFT_551746 [Paraphoma chrysanthemicola]|uniref:Uncharacterized protein n=1 Tax=Paraphoma chrysanthemicola TaxID=798071 RepID=A0A8K0R2J5_9PLEO|nr:hypothetical protein FB567DRAFT_551746 [Paraphoma chrysanthemicola]
MKLSLALVTAIIGTVAAFPAEPFELTSPNRGVGTLMDRDSEGILTKRDCANGLTCYTEDQWLCKCNQGKKCQCVYVESGTPGFPGYWIWSCYDCKKPKNGGLQCIGDGVCNPN